MTSTLQQEGGRKLRMSASQVMRVAQGLYERGYITYMRTDNVTLSDEAMQATRAAVTSQYGQQYLSPSPKQYASKVKNAQEAHEAIRPTTPYRTPPQVSGELNSQDLALYRMIWQRTLASQMADATGVTVSVRLGANVVDGPPVSWPTVNSPRRARRSRSPATGRCTRRGDEARDIDADGDTEQEALLPALAEGDVVPIDSHHAGGSRHHAAGEVHRGIARQATGGVGHRPPVDVGVDHPDDPGPRLRVEEGPGTRPHLDRIRRHPLARGALRRARRLRLHRVDRRGPRRDRPR